VGAGPHARRPLSPCLPPSRHTLVVEDAPEMVAVGEDVRLARQVGAAWGGGGRVRASRGARGQASRPRPPPLASRTRVNDVHAGQAARGGDLLEAQVLFDGDRVVRPALDRRVVGRERRQPAVHAADAGYDAAGGHGLVAWGGGGGGGGWADGFFCPTWRVGTWRRHPQTPARSTHHTWRVRPGATAQETVTRGRRWRRFARAAATFPAPGAARPRLCRLPRPRPR